MSLWAESCAYLHLCSNIDMYLWCCKKDLQNATKLLSYRFLDEAWQEIQAGSEQQADDAWLAHCCCTGLQDPSIEVDVKLEEIGEERRLLFRVYVFLPLLLIPWQNWGNVVFILIKETMHTIGKMETIHIYTLLDI